MKTTDQYAVEAEGFIYDKDSRLRTERTALLAVAASIREQAEAMREQTRALVAMHNARELNFPGRGLVAESDYVEQRGDDR